MNKYPKLLLLLGSFALAYAFYHAGFFDRLGHALNGYGLISMFLGGMLFSFGFTTPFGIGIFVAMAAEVDPLPGAFVAALGSLTSDIVIFQLIRSSVLHDEILRLRTSVIFRRIHGFFHHERFSDRVRLALLWTFAGLVIASPFPDEFGVALVSGTTTIRQRSFIVLSLLFNFLGVLAILLAARAAAL